MSSPTVEKKGYVDFVLRIRKDPKGYVAIPTCPAETGPGPGEPFDSPFQDGDLDELRAFRGSSFRDLDLPKQKVRSKALGERLFATVFSRDVWRFWDSSLDRALNAGHGLRLRLILESPELWDWPWEYLREPGEDFLILSRDISIVRCPEVPRPVVALGVKLPLRVLVVIAEPSGSQELDSDHEWKELRENLAGLVRSGQVVLSRVVSSSLATLRKSLQKPVHVLHFIGHGGFDHSREQAFLQFEKRDGEPDRVTGIDLARVLRRQSPPMLVVLNACEGGRAIKADPFAGVAQALIKEGIPAVVAMQFRVADESALIFSKEFYKVLAEGGMVDQAVYEARQALFSERSVDWGNLVLYLRGSEGVIFKPNTGPSGVSRRLIAAAGAILLAALSAGGYFYNGLSPSGPIGPVPFDGPPRKSIGSSLGCPPIPELDILFKRIEPGTFTMGARGEGLTDAKPHEVTITKPFCMSDTEITIMQWWRVLRENPSKYKKWREQPVEMVSWKRVQDFLKKLRRIDPKANFRLPTEAQWEYAARGGSTTHFSFGNDPGELPKYGNSKDGDDPFAVTSPVGTFAPNNWGLFDMQGNVSEWVADWYAPYDLEPQTDPTGPAAGTERVRRGGSFSILAKNCTVARRNKKDPDNGKDDVGFRIIRDVEP